MNPNTIILSLAVGLSLTASVAAEDRARMAPEYFSPRPSTFNAYIYSATVQLTPSGPQRVLRGEFIFPLFSATPNVSAQIISSNAAAPMQVEAITVDERADPSGSVATVVVVEAKPIFDVAPGGLYYVNVTVTGVPATATKASAL